MLSKFSIFVSVDMRSRVKTDNELRAASAQVSQHLHAARRGLQGLWHMGDGPGLGCRTADYECDSSADARRFRARLGTRMTVRLGAREVVLPVKCDITEREFVDVFVADAAPEGESLDWRDAECEYRDYDDPNDYVALVKVWCKAKRGEVAAALRHLADQLDPAPPVNSGRARSG